MDEINDIGNVIANTIDNKGEDKRNFFGILRAQRGATDLYNISGDSLNLLNEAYKSNKIGADEYKEGLRNIIEATGNDLGLNVSLVYLDTSTMPKDSEGSTGSSYIVDRKNRKVLIPIDVSKIGDINELFGTLTEEISHGKDALEGRQDKKVAEDETNKEKGLESLGRPANDYVKNKLGEDNNSKIKLSTDGIDLSNANVGEKVGDNSLALEVGTIVETGAKTGIGMAAAGVSTPVLVIGGVVIGAFYYTSMPEEQKEQLKEEIYEIYQDVKKSFGSILDKESSKNLVVDVIKYKLKEKGIEADVKIDKDGNVMYTLSPLPEDMKEQRIPPIPLPEEEKNPRIPPMDPPKEETEKEKREREEKARREEQEFFNELQKPNGIPIPKEKPVTIYKIQYKEGDLVELPLDENGKIKDGFIEVRSRDGKGKAYVNEKDNGYWEKDRRAGTSFAHGGSYWKRYPSRRDAEKSEKNRITITSGAEIENDEDTSKKGKGKVLRK
ncbi:hypothetical protein [Fusobacterium sp. HMSC064B11]|uniref:hypothetical protein n=1 Tax=Fusobacterium sp. HMSC064B11 TaxID=1739543 RepID=UPI000AF02950|nr:hypothetical protein [Fusobacterium sp. HMSC064B11]